MKKLFFITFTVLFFSNISIFSQAKFSFFGLGGINYIPMKEFSNNVSALSNSNFDKISFGAKVGFNYRLLDNHHVYLTAEYLSLNASFSSPFVSVKWRFETVPVTLGYEYHFNELTNEFIPLIGLGISYSKFEGERKEGDHFIFGYTSHSDNSWGFEVKFGLYKKLVQNLSIAGEIRYRYTGDFRLNSINDFDEVNLSRIGMNLGIMIKLS
jgi:outer membrane protein W